MAARTGNARSGPPPTPTSIKLARGQTRKSRLPEEVTLPPVPPDKPAGMIAGADEVWDHVVGLLGPTGAITQLDQGAIRQFCEATAIHQATIAAWVKGGSRLTVKNRFGAQEANPLLALIDRTRLAVQTAAREIGASPTSRSSLRVNRSPAADPFEAFLTTRAPRRTPARS